MPRFFQPTSFCPILTLILNVCCEICSCIKSAQKGWLHRDNLFRPGSRSRISREPWFGEPEPFPLELAVALGGAGRLAHSGPSCARSCGVARCPGHHLQSPAHPREEWFPHSLHEEMNSFSAFLPGPWGGPSKIRRVQMLRTQKLSNQQKLHLVKLVFF